MSSKGVSFPADWHITHTENYWANETTTIAHIESIIIPYVKKEREVLSLRETTLLKYCRYPYSYNN